MENWYNENKLQVMIEDNLSKMFGVFLKEANDSQIYKACAVTVNDILRYKRRQYNHKVKDARGKRVYYLSMEFLVGRSLKNNIYNLGMEKEFSSLLSSVHLTLEDLYRHEPDAGLGNGGLGRLGACFMDALASLEYPAMGFSIRYEYGLFKQRIVDGWQTELPDIWLPGGEVWLSERSDKVFSIKFDGSVREETNCDATRYIYENYTEVEAVPYDMMISGATSDAISVIRLWKSQNIRDFDITSFAHGNYEKAMRDKMEADLISKILYPSDDHYGGKMLRLKQQYFLSSASIQNIIKDHIRYYNDILTLPDYVAIHINDTHPALAIPELMRILIDDYNISWSKAWDMVQRIFSYTNHTVLSEALERWPEDFIAKLLPRIYIIIKQINERHLNTARQHNVTDQDIRDLSIFGYHEIRMANLCIAVAHKVNGVSELHSNIIKESIFQPFYRLWPQKFTNVTNGIAYRRWLCQSNPLLTQLLDRTIGEAYHHDASRLQDFNNFIDQDEIIHHLQTIKLENKKAFSQFLKETSGVEINPYSRFDVQIKRVHEYKRQLLNALKIIYLISVLEENPALDMTPQTFIFAGKAAGGYYIAKQIIELIANISLEIAKKPRLKEILNVVYIEDYNVTIAEKLIPASEVSEQISLAGKEASGTGNMKFMINGALTLGTLDGANVEICQAAGEANAFIFGMKAHDVEDLWRQGYLPSLFVERSPRLQRTIERLIRGFNNKNFQPMVDYLLKNYPVSDPYMCLADFDSYLDVHNQMDNIYKDQHTWNQMSLANIAAAGIFSADRSITTYADTIWNLKKIR